MDRNRNAKKPFDWERVRKLTWRQAWAYIQPFWPPTPLQALTFVGLLFILALGGYIFDWTGFGEPARPVGENPQGYKTLWDWMSLLIVPVVAGLGVAIITAWFTVVGGSAPSQTPNDMPVRPPCKTTSTRRGT